MMNPSASTSSTAKTQKKIKKRKYEDITTDDDNATKEETEEEDKKELFPISKFGNIIEKTRYLSDMFDKSSKKFRELHEKFKEIENDWNHYYLYYFLGDEPRG
jgi:hypothetical protein